MSDKLQFVVVDKLKPIGHQNSSRSSWPYFGISAGIMLNSGTSRIIVRSM